MLKKLKKLKPTKRQWTWIGSTAGVLALGTGGWAWWNSLPPSANAAPVKIVEYVATEEFANLPSSEKQAYLDAMSADMGKFMEAARSSNLTDDQRREAMGNVFMAREEARADAYFALEPGPARDQYLDKLIDEWDQRASQWGGRGGQNRGPGANAGQGRQRGDGPGPGGPGGGGGGFGGGGRGSPERLKSRMESIPPGVRTKMAEFRRAMRDRRQARGQSSGR